MSVLFPTQAATGSGLAYQPPATSLIEQTAVPTARVTPLSNQSAEAPLGTHPEQSLPSPHETQATTNFPALTSYSKASVPSSPATAFNGTGTMVTAIPVMIGHAGGTKHSVPPTDITTTTTITSAQTRPNNASNPTD